MSLSFDRPKSLEYELVDLRHNLAEVKRRHGKSVLRQLLEMAPLVLAGQRLSPSDYYRYQLFDDAQFTIAERREFIGDNRYWEILFRISDWRSCTLSDDKLVTSALLACHGLGVPEIRAVFHPHRSYPGARALSSGKLLGEFLRDEAAYPLFGKPVAGFESRAIVCLQAYKRRTDELILLGNEKIPVDQFVRDVEKLNQQKSYSLLRQGPGQAYIFQEVLKQHETLEQRCGKMVCCLRIPVILQESGPRILQPLLEIPAPGKIAGDFWGQDILMAAVDRTSGQLTRVVSGKGADLEFFKDNPFTHEPLLGMTVPFFDEAVKAVLRGATIFPGSRYQGWDLAITPDGPVIMEVNNGSSFVISQVSSGKGLYDLQFREFIQWAESQNATASLMLSSKWRGHTHWLGPLHGAWIHLAQLWRKQP